MRIIGGRLKGKTIYPPMGYKARPTTDFAREGLFNILGNEYEFEDLKVLDLFGGTGAVSYEFASRGAARVYCVEMSRDNAAFIKREAASVAHEFGFDLSSIVRAFLTQVARERRLPLDVASPLPNDESLREVYRKLR